MVRGREPGPRGLPPASGENHVGCTPQHHHGRAAPQRGPIIVHLKPSAAFAGLAITFAVVMIGTTMPTPMYALYQHELGFSPLVQTVIFAVYAVGVLTALLVTGSWSDQLGRRPVLLAGIALALLSSLVFLFAGPVQVLLAGRVLSGFSAGIFAGAATAAVIEAAPPAWRNRGPAVATVANIGGLGLGAALAGLAVQFLPAPLHLSFAVHAVAVALCGLLVLAAPETVRDRPARPVLRPRALTVPGPVRAVFAISATAGIAGFATIGLFTALSPRIVAEIIGNPNHAVAGLMPLLMLGSSVIAQVVVRDRGTDRTLDAGCVLLVLGAGLVALSVAQESMAELVGGALVAGAGQGMTFATGLAAVNSRVDAQQRAGVTSTYFVVLYLAISVPIIGLGAASQVWDLTIAGIVFCAGVAVLATVALGALQVLKRSTATERDRAAPGPGEREP
ncbi:MULTISPECIES: MFS transporter [Pseudonocardia]|uniref:Multidrug efflux system protein MdtL n=2 Tax=Pseudonocardia TaxID=1847 RepID=A0A1Y2N349_PSEAH|nr:MULTISPECIES: MFS transporter [Pseudonocardia]OSY41527.1 multidrug efflux system protein MdtL [Pseudonocardia autotrophica]TDN71482.1 putative MFS family arabinose efflux permease [Pseudonocardia autotrophica]BBG02159.1 putative multi-drug efflux transporter [Pseudonocardia autotrophica]GEC24173.1 putative multi-drug efflux transporter [Pseudonocardia saturnea]